jgi:hypothetical protein
MAVGLVKKTLDAAVDSSNNNVTMGMGNGMGHKTKIHVVEQNYANWVQNGRT